MNYSMLDEIWDNYKYPKKPGQHANSSLKSSNETRYSPTTTQMGGYSMELDGNESSNPDPVHMEEFKPIHQTVSQQPSTPNSQPTESNRFVNHPSNTNQSSTNTYNNIPYTNNEVYSPMQTYMTNGGGSTQQQQQQCMSTIQHIRTCRYCFEHMRRELNLDKKEKTLLDFLPKIDMNTVILVIGGIATGLVLSDLLSRSRRRR
jgi:hypothetical protein